jgi:hypothetical protein
MNAKFFNDDPGIRLLGLQLAAKRTEEAARRSLGDSLVGPSTLVPVFFRTWQAAKAAEWATHLTIRQSTRRVVVPMIRRAIA